MMDDLIRKLSEIRSEYNCFDKDEESYYHALSEAIGILSRCVDGDTISRQDAIDLWEQYRPYIATKACEYDTMLRKLPSAQPEHLVKESGGLVKDLVNDTISRQGAIKALNTEIIKRRLLDDVNDGMLDEFDTEDVLRKLPPADVQPVTFCKNCQWLADIKDVDTGEMYHTCGVLGFDVPDGFACNQGKRKGVDNE